VTTHKKARTPFSTDLVEHLSLDLKHGRLLLNGRVTEGLLEQAFQALTLADGIPLTIFINSSGGSLIDGFGIYDLIKQLSPKSNTVAIGDCSSMATVILQAGHKRYATSNTSFMIHRGTVAQPEDTTANNQNWLDEVKRLQKQMVSIYRKRLKVEPEALEQLLNENSFLDCGSALHIGLIDEVLK
jgi:ATP-dependent Clp protease protease subunit